MEPENKDSRVHIRVSEEEKRLIEEKAREFGGSVSEYARTVLQDPEKDLNGRLGQVLAAALCKHATIVARLRDPHAREALSRWEAELWRNI